jgi:L-2-hydroxyglutarate oxidase LhgO
MDSEGIVIGAGAVGLAVAASLARRGQPVLVLEERDGVGQGISSRNSEVIHAGIYYPPGSLKAETCVEGRERLYRRCAAQRIPHRRTGKLLVATTEDETETLEQLRKRGEQNGAGNLEILDGDEVRRREARLRTTGALWSPESGIVDAHALVSSYQAEAEAHGARVVLRTRVIGLERHAPGWTLHTESAEGERFPLRAPFVVNAAGLASDRIAEMAGLDIDALGWRIRPCKGSYFGVAPGLGPLSRHLVYPVPVPGGLGIHLTLDLGGRYRLGPDVEYVAEPDYVVDASKAETFAEAVSRFLPGIRPSDLSPDFAGVRPKLQGPGEPVRDFVIDDGSAHGAPGLVSLIGIESPGLTAAGAIAERVANQLA